MHAGPVELPWWGYGPAGMQLWFTSSLQPGVQPVSLSASSSLPGLPQLQQQEQGEAGDNWFKSLLCGVDIITVYGNLCLRK